MIDRPKLPPVRKHAIYSDDPILCEINARLSAVEAIVDKLHKVVEAMEPAPTPDEPVG